MRLIKAWKHVILLVIIVGALTSQSLAPHRGAFGPTLHEIVITFSLFAVLLIIFESRLDRIIALAAGSVTAGSSWVRHFVPAYDGTGLTIVHDVAVALFLGFAVVEILRNIFRRRSVRADDVIGSVCGFLLAGAAWASLYSLVDQVVAGSFSISPSLAAQLDGWHSRQAMFEYFSFVTLATIGYGDVTPVRGPATALAWLEAVFGQFYIAVVVAQLVAVRLTQALRPDDPGPG